ncbi:MAG: DNA translocase FtsK 4TM domain-containing protein [Candidatus Paceibacterota bacterium]|jgi:S-DNA-T family DNA segregation ATPase FtsK/SpoIIIE
MKKRTQKEDKQEEKKKRESKRDREVSRSRGFLKDETLQSIVSIIFLLLALLFTLASIGPEGMAGRVGRALYNFFHELFGLGYYLIPLLFVMLGAAFLRSLEQRFSTVKIVFGLVFFFPALGLIEIASIGAGGIVGAMLVNPLVALFDVTATIIVLMALIVISILVIFDTHLQRDWLALLRKLSLKKEQPEEDEKEVVIKNGTQEETKPAEAKITVPEEKKQETGGIFAKKKEPEVGDGFDLKQMHARHFSKEYVPPPLSLLETDKGKPGVGDVKANANIIKRTLQNFGIDVEMDEITIGPTVARYALKPAEGVRLSKISSLQDNLALALAAPTIRVEAPIPGKSLVGIEVPNSSKTTVGLGSLLSSPDYQNSPKPLMTSIGKNVSGEAVFYDLAKMPHLLIAGTTGSGKSVTVHAILNSLIFRNSPDLLKFIMVDAKRVELTLYNKIPHLLTPVITEAKKTILALKWAAKEMDRRYDALEKSSVRDISSYHKNILEPALKKAKDDKEAALPETMPYIVIVIDELADLMQAYPRELEACIVRLAQMSRAVGIHLILSTQRPSVNVITGLIKANIPTRIALKVGSQIDSRTIIDKAGAEKLVGGGDMLFATQESPEPVRIQSPYISENEVKKVVKYLVDNYADEVPSEVGAIMDEKQQETRNPIFDPALMSEGSDSADDDDLYEEAKEIVIQAGKASTSYIQRKLRVGYARAARLMDILEERGVIGPADGAKPREVIGGGGSSSDTTEEVF